KICITSRNRGFIPEKEVEVFDIAPLDRTQIETYVDKIIHLGKFDIKDKASFLKQTKILVEKGFLNSFLILSLLINIYKAERELPENKLDLYQKCFEYIANRREKEKTQGKYDWRLIGPLMKDNTFMELSNMCLPNNSDIDKESIKGMLTKVYKSKFGSYGETESAVDEFLAFCSDRTELFVPSAGEDKFKFFHRSFFEYFYSQYIFTRYQNVEDIYNNISKFDIDSEIFELTMAMLKQKNEDRYQELIEYIFSKMNMEAEDGGDKLYPLNILLLGMQVIDDELYKKRLVQFLVDNYMLIIKKIENLHNQRVLIDLIEDNQIYLEQINNTYKDFAIFSVLETFVMLFPKMLEISKQINYNIKHNQKTKSVKDIEYSKEMRYFKYRFIDSYSNKFYNATFFYSNEPYKVINSITLEYIDLLSRKCGAKKKDAGLIKKSFSEYISLEKDAKNTVNSIFFD
ncbi:MAG TPA: hypothetical protein VHT96_08775, partial [Clostridia bacterium]|nr:hypothetical protein [Clostridia bacterium]